MPESRSSVYRGVTREQTEAAYHADAKAAAAGGYVPASEEWSVALGQQVLTVGYVFEPDQVPAVLEALTATETQSTQHASSPTAQEAPLAKVEGTESAPKVGRGIWRGVVLLGIALFALVAWQQGVFSGGKPDGGSAGNIPPPGQIWFGNAFDPDTFAVSGRTTTVGSGQAVVLVAQFPRSVSSGEINLRTSIDGTLIGNQNVSMQGSGELFGVSIGPFYGAGSYRYEITDLGGNVLASGTLTVTE